MREAVEDASGGLVGRMNRLRAVCALPQFDRWVAAEGGATAMCDRFFPPILTLVPGLPNGAQAELNQMGLCTVAALQAAPDGALLRVKGVGPSKLQSIREFCDEYEGDPSAERAANVNT